MLSYLSSVNRYLIPFILINRILFMFKICLTLTRYNLTKIEGCLKVLKLDPPTTKKEIKLKYL
jgi:hypothetical protein